MTYASKRLEAFAIIRINGFSRALISQEEELLSHSSVLRRRKELKSAANSDTASNNSDSKDDESSFIGPTTRRAWNDWCSSSSQNSQSSTSSNKNGGHGGKRSSCRSSGDENEENNNTSANIVTANSTNVTAPCVNGIPKRRSSADIALIKSTRNRSADTLDKPSLRRRTTQRRAAANKPPIIEEPDPPVAVSLHSRVVLTKATYLPYTTNFYKQFTATLSCSRNAFFLLCLQCSSRFDS